MPILRDQMQVVPMLVKVWGVGVLEDDVPPPGAAGGALGGLQPWYCGGRALRIWKSEQHHLE